MTPTSPLVKRAIEAVREKVERSEREGFVWNSFDLIDVRALLDEYDRLAVTPGAPDRGTHKPGCSTRLGPGFTCICEGLP